MPSSNLEFYLLLLTATSVIAALIAIYAWQHRQTRGARFLSFTMTDVAIWALFSAFSAISGSVEAANFWSTHMRMVVIAVFPVLALGFALEYTGRDDLLRWNRLGLLLIIPILVQIANWIAPETFVSDSFFVVQNGLNLLDDYDLAPGFLLHTIYSYALIFLAQIVLLRFALQRTGTHRMQALVLFASTIAPFAVNFIASYEIVPLPPFDWTAIAFSTTSLILAWAIFRLRLFDLVPFAHQTILAGMREAVFVLDHENRIVDVNAAAEKLQPVAPVMFDQDELVINNHIYDVSSAPLTRQGKTVGRVVVLRDVTRQREDAEKAQRTEIARERSTLLTQFLEGASHEFRTPLSVIRTSTYIARRTDDPDKRAERLDIIDNQTERMIRLLENVLTMGRLEQRTHPMLAPVKLNGLIQDTLSNLDSGAVTIQTKLPSGLPPLRGDHEMLRTVLMAVIDNAVRYTNPGGTVTIETEHVAGAWITVIVKDTGIGIEPEHVPRIFDAFFRVDQARTLSGFGVGLTIASRIMALHAGEIDVTSTPGEGSQVTLKFPVNSYPKRTPPRTGVV